MPVQLGIRREKLLTERILHYAFAKALRGNDRQSFAPVALFMLAFRPACSFLD
jgi:hypothetical protein